MSDGSNDDTAELRRPDATLELPRTERPAPVASITVIFAVVAVFGLVIGATAATFARGQVGGTVVQDEVVGPAGATLGFSGQGRLEIPEGALDRPTRIVIRAGRVPGGRTAYVFEPADLRFAEPVFVVLPADGDGAVAVATRGRVLVGIGPPDGFTITDFRFGR